MCYGNSKIENTRGIGSCCGSAKGELRTFLRVSPLREVIFCKLLQIFCKIFPNKIGRNERRQKPLEN